MLGDSIGLITVAVVVVVTGAPMISVIIFFVIIVNIVIVLVYNDASAGLCKGDERVLMERYASSRGSALRPLMEQR